MGDHVILEAGGIGYPGVDPEAVSGAKEMRAAIAVGAFPPEVLSQTVEINRVQEKSPDTEDLEQSPQSSEHRYTES